jgi:Protein of unknown function (DUF1569)
MKTLAHPRDTQEILRRLSALRDDTPRRWGRMSAHQMVCHLTDGYRMMIGERPAPAVASAVPPPIMRCIALYVPLRWPRGVATTAELDQHRGGGTPPTDFSADVAELERRVARIGVDAAGRFARTHPIFGAMSESAWRRWAYLHADHHLRQFGL